MTRTSSASKKARLVGAYLKGRPIWCSWQLSRRCDRHCLFCEHRLEGGDEEADFAALGKVVESLDGLGSLVVSLAGSDPFIRRELVDLVSLLARAHFPLVTTHGWLVTPAKARSLWQAGLEGASVLFHDADPRRHDEMAGLPGTHARAVAALDAFASERVRPTQQVSVKMRLMGDDLAPVEPLLGLAADHGASLTLEPGFPLHPDAVPGKPLSAPLLELKRRHPQLHMGSFFLGKLDLALSGGVPGCLAGRAFLNVDHRGRVSKCLEFQGPDDRVGDLTREGMDTVLPRLNRLNRENTCRSCWYAARGEIEGLYTVRGLLSALPALVRA